MKDENLDNVINELVDNEDEFNEEFITDETNEEYLHGHNKKYYSFKKELDSVGCGFCLAKWTQVTIHLQTGHTHSCHHPDTHKVPISEIKRDPSSLHNTRFKKKRRREMLEGKRPDECDYCWRVEDNSNRFSDRLFKSIEEWSQPHFEHIKNSHWRENFNPRYVEVAFSNACNFKCSYCAPQFSSTWMEEVNKYGGYPTTDNFNSIETMIKDRKVPIPHKDYNPYVEAFWKWWPELYRDLHTFRITGGEPLLAKDTWRVLDYIIEEKNPNRDLTLGINSNLGAPDKLIDNFIEKIKKIEDEKRVKNLIIYTSVDTWGKQAEYIRNGLEFNRFWDNINKILTNCSRTSVVIMSTYNALSVPNYHKLIDGVYDLKSQYTTSERYWDSAVILDSSYLRYPTHQTVQVLDSTWDDVVFKQAQQTTFLETPNPIIPGYLDIEIQKIKRIYDWMITRDKNLELNTQRYDFGKYFTEHDKRRGTNFEKTFPELADFFNYTKTIKL